MESIQDEETTEHDGTDKIVTNENIVEDGEDEVKLSTEIPLEEEYPVVVAESLARPDKVAAIQEGLQRQLEIAFDVKKIFSVFDSLVTIIRDQQDELKTVNVQLEQFDIVRPQVNDIELTVKSKIEPKLAEHDEEISVTKSSISECDEKLSIQDASLKKISTDIFLKVDTLDHFCKQNITQIRSKADSGLSAVQFAVDDIRGKVTNLTTSTSSSSNELRTKIGSVESTMQSSISQLNKQIGALVSAVSSISSGSSESLAAVDFTPAAEHSSDSSGGTSNQKQNYELELEKMKDEFALKEQEMQNMFNLKMMEAHCNLEALYQNRPEGFEGPPISAKIQAPAPMSGPFSSHPPQFTTSSVQHQVATGTPLIVDFTPYNKFNSTHEALVLAEKYKAMANSRFGFANAASTISKQTFGSKKQVDPAKLERPQRKHGFDHLNRSLKKRICDELRLRGRFLKISKFKEEDKAKVEKFHYNRINRRLLACEENCRKQYERLIDLANSASFNAVEPAAEGEEEGDEGGSMAEESMESSVQGGESFDNDNDSEGEAVSDLEMDDELDGNEAEAEAGSLQAGDGARSGRAIGAGGDGKKKLSKKLKKALKSALPKGFSEDYGRLITLMHRIKGAGGIQKLLFQIHRAYASVSNRPKWASGDEGFSTGGKAKETVVVARAGLEGGSLDQLKQYFKELSAKCVTTTDIQNMLDFGVDNDHPVHTLAVKLRGLIYDVISNNELSTKQKTMTPSRMLTGTPATAAGPGGGGGGGGAGGGMSQPAVMLEIQRVQATCESYADSSVKASCDEIRIAVRDLKVQMESKLNSFDNKTTETTMNISENKFALAKLSEDMKKYKEFQDKQMTAAEAGGVSKNWRPELDSILMNVRQQNDQNVATYAQLSDKLQKMQSEMGSKPTEFAVNQMLELTELTFKRTLGENVVGLKQAVGQVVKAVQSKASREEVAKIITDKVSGLEERVSGVLVEDASAVSMATKCLSCGHSAVSRKRVPSPDESSVQSYMSANSYSATSVESNGGASDADIYYNNLLQGKIGLKPLTNHSAPAQPKIHPYLSSSHNQGYRSKPSDPVVEPVYLKARHANAQKELVKLPFKSLVATPLNQQQMYVFDSMTDGVGGGGGTLSRNASSTSSGSMASLGNANLPPAQFVNHNVTPLSFQRAHTAQVAQRGMRGSVRRVNDGGVKLPGIESSSSEYMMSEGYSAGGEVDDSDSVMSDVTLTQQQQQQQQQARPRVQVSLSSTAPAAMSKYRV